MAARIPRIPRLTLFSGPNCSLCDIAKAELAKVRQSRQFQLDTINIQDKGQEKWKKKYVYWIPALHLDGKEIAKGRWDSQIVIKALSEWDKISQPECLPNDYEPYGVYIRADTTEILGIQPNEEERDPESAFNSSRTRCFNCGHDEHTVKDCPFRRNYDLIDLSRQYYKLAKGTLGLGNWERLHTAEEWRQTRLNWLEEFQPGQIKGGLLLDALGVKNSREEWLRNMAIWGYPKGWVSEEDPQELVRERIWKEHGGDVEAEFDDIEPFMIFGEEHSEEVKFSGSFQRVPHENGEQTSTTYLSESPRNPSSPNASSSSIANVGDQQNSGPLKRWAIYPSAYFLSELLPVYSGFSLPPLSDSDEPSQSFPTRPAPQADYPVHLHHVTGSNQYIGGDAMLPPPPTEPPPPLPPVSGTFSMHHTGPIDPVDDGSDMELSDAD